MSIALSILEYEAELSEKVEKIVESQAFKNIIRLIETGRIHSVHIDVMRPPLIPGKIKFSTSLIRRLYEELINKTRLNAHLMVSDPIGIINEIDRFVSNEHKTKITIIVQVEAFGSENDAVEAIRLIRRYGYRVGIGLNLPTPEDMLTDRIVHEADMVLVMSVPMGLGGQRYSSTATERIRRIAGRFPGKEIWVDGGINPETIVEALRAGARVAVVGSYITLNRDPIKALAEIEDAIETFKRTSELSRNLT